MVLFMRSGLMNRRFLGLTSGVDVLASCEDLIDPGEAETTV